MKAVDLFAGLGGFTLGFGRAGIETVAAVEKDEFCQALYAQNFPDIPMFGDVRTFNADRLGRTDIDIITAGYPCQPFSQAGKRLGDKDDRHLWPEVRRLLDEFRPAWFIGENVAGHISMGLDEVLSDLESSGYTARPFVIPAVAKDAPHRRDRVWIVADTDSNNAQRVKSQRHDAQDGQVEGERQVGLRCGEGRWLPEPNVGRVAHGVPKRVDRLKALGNAVVPQIPEMIGRAIMELENE